MPMILGILTYPFPTPAQHFSLINATYVGLSLAIHLSSWIVFLCLHIEASVVDTSHNPNTGSLCNIFTTTHINFFSSLLLANTLPLTSLPTKIIRCVAPSSKKRTQFRCKYGFLRTPWFHIQSPLTLVDVSQLSHNLDPMPTLPTLRDRSHKQLLTLSHFSASFHWALLCVSLTNSLCSRPHPKMCLIPSWFPNKSKLHKYDL